jgi:hypothetical protein
MLWALAETGEELNRQQVEKASHEPPDAILRLAVLTRPVLDRQFADLEPSGMGKDRDEAMQLPIQSYLASDLGSKQLETTIVIM